VLVQPFDQDLAHAPTLSSGRPPAGDRLVLIQATSRPSDSTPSERVITVSSDTNVRFEEQLRVPLRWWVQATMFVASIWLAFVVALPAVVAWGAAAFLVLLVVGLFLGYGGARLRVGDDVFRAGPATIPVRLLSDPAPLDAAATHRLAGRDANGRAYHLLRPYLKLSVRVTVDDPNDPVPYWLVSTRRPAELAAALSAAQSAAGPAVERRCPDG